MSSLSASEQEELSASRIADYLKNPAASHVQPQHVSVHVSLHILSKKKSHIQALENVLSNNKE
jgi:hypothetical protein